VAKFPKSGELDAGERSRAGLGRPVGSSERTHNSARIMGERLSQEDLAREMCMTANTFTSRNGNY